MIYQIVETFLSFGINKLVITWNNTSKNIMVLISLTIILSGILMINGIINFEPKRTISISGEVKDPYDGNTPSAPGNILITYDDNFKITETPQLTLVYTPPQPAILIWFTILPHKSDIEISVSGPEIEVTGPNVRSFGLVDFLPNKQNSDKSNSTIELSWLYRAKTPGDNKLQISMKNLPDFPTTIRINNEDVELSETLVLPLNVLTRAGLSPTTEQYLVWLGAILSFILAYPILITLLQSKIGAKAS